MAKYIGKRALRSLMTVTIVFVAVFMLLRFMPLEGYFSDEMIKEADEATRMSYLRNLGLLDHPFVQLGRFLGNLFMPLDGTLFTLSRFTPIYGVGALGTRPILGDDVIMMSGIATEALWVPLTNMIAWTLLFALMCLAARRRTTRRR